MTFARYHSGAMSTSDALARLRALCADRRIVALTGAGCSTESGIPDYRGPGTRERARNPIQGRTFRDREDVRRRYWARAAIGWRRFSGARPNPAHHALAQLEQSGRLEGIVTQNVDGLHHDAGSRRVVELHGNLRTVSCLACRIAFPRDDVQDRLESLNPGWTERVATVAPDGDADVEGEAIAAFRVPACEACGGVLKPDVVFFGESVAKHVVGDAFALLDRGEVLLVVGSSLAVFSGFRFVREAAARGMPIGLVNLGEARGSELCTVHVEARAGEVLIHLV
jgi:NAD-dependent deacetylase sirtuin 4